MEGIEMVCFEIITEVGNARSLYIEAIQEAKEGSFDRAEELMKEGRAAFANGHHAHADLAQKEAEGEPAQSCLLLMHAEDQLMSAEAFGILAREFIDVYKKIG